MSDQVDRQFLDICVSVNGAVHRLVVEPHETLAAVLRERLGLTGTKISCDMEVCGACTVLVNRRAVSSCTFLAFEADGAEVLTIEGLEKDGSLDPVQEAFLAEGAFQCGFCTPGMIMTAKAMLYETSNPSVEDITHYLQGCICRCTGYASIIRAVQLAARLSVPEPGRSVGGAQGT